MQTGMLRMFREDSAQHYRLTRATWGFSESNRYQVPILCLAIETEEQPSTFEEDDGWPHKPRWRLDIWARGMDGSLIRPGAQFSIPSWYDDFTGVMFTMFHYDEHEGTEDNVVKILKRENEFLDLSIEGHIRDETASMRPTRITVDARFTKRTPHEEIDAQLNRPQLPPHDPPYGATYLAPKTS
jgi:hypothetical protein